MIPNLMTWCLLVAVLVIVFVGGYQIGKLAEQDAQRARVARRLVPLHRMMRHERLATFAKCPTCGAAPGEDCVPQGRRPSMTGGPVRPIGVYIIQPNGDTIPVELAYAGVEDGLHVWDAITPLPAGGQLKVGMFPAGTSIRLPAAVHDEE